jgi:hypothetical protein
MSKVELIEQLKIEKDQMHEDVKKQIEVFYEGLIAKIDSLDASDKVAVLENKISEASAVIVKAKEILSA